VIAYPGKTFDRRRLRPMRSIGQSLIAQELSGLLVLRRVLQLVALRGVLEQPNELEIIVLRHELGILRRQTGRSAMTSVDRLFLAASRLLPRER
jgi:hypothetical protein